MIGAMGEDGFPPGLGAELFAGAREGLFLVEEDGRIVAANPAAAVFYGNQDGGLRGRCLADLAVEPGRVAEALRGRSTLLPPHYHRRDDGTTVAVGMSLNYVRLAERALVLVTVRDATDILALEQALRDAEARLRGVFAAAPSPMVVLDARGTLVDANGAAQSLYGAGRETLVGRRIGALLVDPLLASEYGALGRDRLPLHWHRRDDGREFLAEVTLSAVSQADGPSLVVVLRDVTDTQSGLESARLSEQRWQYALEACGQGLWEWNTESGEMYASSRFLEQLGFAADDVPPSTYDAWESHIHPDDFERVRRAVHAHFCKEVPWIDVDARLMNRQGLYRWTEIRGRAMLHDAASKPLRVVGTVRDIHHERLREAQERVQHEQFLHSQRLSGLGEMATALAHELNQPLAAMGNFAAVLSRRLKGKVDDPDVNRCVDNISQLVARAGDIVRRIRDFTRQGGMQVTAVDVNALVEEMARFSELQASFLVADLVLDLDPELPEIEGDRLQLGQLILNLAKNGLEAMSEVPGRRVLAFRTRCLDAEQVELTVEDLGEGLPDFALPDVFQPFSTTKANGVGLGLAICRTIVEHHGGRLWATPNHPRGTIFHAVLPVKQGS